MNPSPSPAANVAARRQCGHRQTRRLAQRFDAAAPEYERYAGVQPAVADHLLACITEQTLPPAPRILEIGCGTGLLSRKLAARFPDATWTITDLAPAMLEQARRSLRLNQGARFLIMDGEHPEPSLADPGFDLICSSMVVQWFSAPAQGMARLAGLLAPGGCLAVAVPVEGTWTEWRAAHRSLGLRPAMIPLPSAACLQAPHAAFQATVHTQRYIEACDSGLDFLRRLRGIGATAPRPGSQPMTVSQLRRVCAAFEQAGAQSSYRIAFSLWRRHGAARRAEETL
ncbi:MAG: methyltransferase [Castellaniella sp.]|uniref:methyltransferase n=1 Tax=Castellaniella sp. TaxID=1955812 RepID=UPI003C731316